MNNGLSSARMCIDKGGPFRGVHAPVIRSRESCTLAISVNRSRHLALLTDLFDTIEVIVLDVPKKRFAAILDHTHSCPLIQPREVGFHGTRTTVRHGHQVTMVGPDWKIRCLLTKDLVDDRGLSLSRKS